MTLVHLDALILTANAKCLQGKVPRRRRVFTPVQGRDVLLQLLKALCQLKGLNQAKGVEASVPCQTIGRPVRVLGHVVRSLGRYLTT